MSLTHFHTFPQTQALLAGLIAQGIQADLYQDGTSGGLLCVIVPLVEGEIRTAEYRDHLLISTEDESLVNGQGRRWFGGLYLVNQDSGDCEWVDDVNIEVPQRTWLGDTEADVARSLVPLLKRLGAQPVSA